MHALTPPFPASFLSTYLLQAQISWTPSSIPPAIKVDDRSRPWGGRGGPEHSRKRPLHHVAQAPTSSPSCFCRLGVVLLVVARAAVVVGCLENAQRSRVWGGCMEGGRGCARKAVEALPGHLERCRTRVQNSSSRFLKRHANVNAAKWAARAGSCACTCT
jgi:hypothetical protein